MNTRLRKFLHAITQVNPIPPAVDENYILLLEDEDISIEEIPVFSEDHGDSCFDEEQALINQLFAESDLYPAPNIE